MNNSLIGQNNTSHPQKTGHSIRYSIVQRLSRVLPDKLFLQLLYFRIFKKWLNLQNPSTYNEKINWLKLYNNDPRYTQMVDKYAVRRFVAERIGAQYLKKCYGVWRHADEIDFERLPDRFVLKCTHDSHSTVICTDKSTLDDRTVKENLEKALAHPFFIKFRENAYKDVPPRVIAEAYLCDKELGQLVDYRFFCFDGEIKMILIDFDPQLGWRRNIYTPDWQFLDVWYGFDADRTFMREPPAALPLMKELAQKLSAGIPHVRVDLFLVDGQVYFGEMTFYPTAGFCRIKPESFHVEMGSWIRLPDKNRG